MTRSTMRIVFLVWRILAVSGVGYACARAYRDGDWALALFFVVGALYLAWETGEIWRASR